MWISEWDKQARFLIIFLFFCTISSIKGQLPPVYHFGLEQGLPTLSLYDLEVDAEGYLWIAADSGLLKFDGNDFIPHPAGILQSAEALRLFRAPDDAIWFLDLKGNICIYKNDSLSIIDSIGVNSDFQHIYFLANQYQDILILNEHYQNAFWFDQASGTFDRKRYALPLKGLVGNTIVGFDQSFVTHSRDFLSIISPSGYQEFKTPRINLNGPSKVCIWEDKYLLNSGKQLYTFDPKNEQFENVFEEFAAFWENEILGIFIYDTDNIWISTDDGVVRLFRNNGAWQIQHLLKGIIAGDIEKDWQGNIWFSTRQNGLYLLSASALKMRFYPNDKLTVNSLDIDQKNNLYIGYEGGLLEKRNANFDLVQSLQIETGNSRLYELEYSDFHQGLFVAAKNIYLLEDDFSITKQLTLNSCKVVDVAPDHSVWFGSANAVGIFADNSLIKLEKRSYAVCPVNEDLAYVGTLKGLVKIQKESPFVMDTIAGIDKDIRALDLDKYGNLWVGTQNKGVYVLKNDFVIAHFYEQNLIPDFKCLKIETDNKYSWLLSPQAIIRINIDNYNDIAIIDKTKGLSALAMNDLALSENEVAVGAANGVYFFDKSADYAKDSMLLSVSKILINGESQEDLDEININGKENRLRIDLKVISFVTADQIEFAYQLEGIEEEWTYSKEKFVNYSGLLPGEYLFNWKARFPGQDWQFGRSRSVNVKPLFSETFLAKLLTFGMAIIVGALIFWLVNKNRNAQRKLASQLNQAQIMSVRARMNPHFVFNALNSIQDFILHANIRDANRYLGRFSKLMRNVLFVSEQSSISLEKELETLDLYLSLEQLRFDNDFHFNIEVDPSINITEVLIPPMMIQPYVENSVKHGLLHKSGEKKLELRINSEVDKLIVEIVDNGIGRAAARAILEKSNLPLSGKGMELSEQQLALINKFKGEAHSVQITDLKDVNGLSLGTKVKLVLSLTSFQDIIEQENNVIDV